MDQNNLIECGGFYFIHNFDSGNLGHVERVPTEHIVPGPISPKSNLSETPDYEFNLWTRPDCAGTEFENGNRTWFYFGVQATEPNVLVRLNLINLNKQGKMYNQGMAPVTRTLPGKPQWERIRDRPIHSMDDNTFTLSFKYRTAENIKATTFFAFTYPFSFAELQISLNSIDLKMLPLPPPMSPDDIYYSRECLVYSLEGRRVDLLTISSYHGITSEREERLKNLFPENQERPFKFHNKKVIFISARVHPGETPSSFVFNGFLNLILNRHDPIAIMLRKVYVFKMIPFLNPDGVARGHYRTDTRGVNLNRVYLNPSLALHPTVYASRALIRYYHFGCELEDSFDDCKSITSRSMQNLAESSEGLENVKKKKGVSAVLTKSTDCKRDKPAAKLIGNKSSITIKPPPDHKHKDSKTISGDAAILADQVLDMSIHDMPSQTCADMSCDVSTSAVQGPSLLNDSMLRSCLGSNVHLSSSGELNIQGSNPLRPLRESLKNSISLLMGSSTSVGDGVPTSTNVQLSNVKMGWCGACRRQATKPEDTLPGYGIMSVYPTSLLGRSDNSMFNTIDEYRKHQLEKLDECKKESRKTAGDEDNVSRDDTIYFCTNCFKKYILNIENEEISICDTEVELSSACTPAAPAEPPAPLADVRTPPRTREPHKADSLVRVDTLAPSDPLAKDVKQRASSASSARQKKSKPAVVVPTKLQPVVPHKENDSGLYLYIDLHGHASKKGIFMYGNHFSDHESSVECMLLPRIMSLNNLHFHFSSCNFTEKNMYLKDRRDGMSREGSGRVAVLKATGLVRSYTLECNYNTGRLVNVLPPTVHDGFSTTNTAGGALVPPKYTPHIFEEVKYNRARTLEVFGDMDPVQVGRSLGASILDLTGQHPNSRIPGSEHRTLASVRDWLRAHSRSLRPHLGAPRVRHNQVSPIRVPLYARSKAKVTEERKENTFARVLSEERRRSPPALAHGHDIVNINVKVTKKNEPVKTSSRSKYLADSESKAKSLTCKRRNILAIRKPNSSKTQIGGIVKPKISRRSVDDSESPRGSLTNKLSKRSFARSLRVCSERVVKIRKNALASSSSDDMIGGHWEEVAGGTVLSRPDQVGLVHADSLTMPGKRRVFPNAPPHHLKKIRLKTGL